MYYVNKLVGALLNPYAIGLFLIVMGMLGLWARKRMSLIFAIVGIAWLWFWSIAPSCRWMGGLLETPWLNKDGTVPVAESLPEADLIVLLSGGMGANTNVTQYSELFGGADRAYHTARLYKAKKAPRIVLTGDKSRESTIPFLRDLGVPEDIILVDNDSMNTEENAKFTAGLLAGLDRPRVLLVTSAYHMRRSVLMFRKYAPDLEIIPAATDFEMTIIKDDPFRFESFVPNAGSIALNCIYWKELIGYLGYKFLR